MIDHNTPDRTVAKKSKSDLTTESSSSAVNGGDSPAAEAAVPQKKKRKPAAKTSSGKKASRKATATKTGKKTAPRRGKPAQPAEPSDADIRLRAYFIAERRVQLALQGDPNRDWLEAKQQLLDEARQARS